MKNNNLIIVGAVIIGVIIIAGVGGYMLLGQKTNSNEKITVDKKVEENTPINVAMVDEEKIAEDNSSSKYILHTKGIIEKTNDSERVLFFYANWCPTCRPVDKELSENQNQIPEGLRVIRINYNDPETEDEEDELAKKYGINYQHTFVHVDEEGNEISTWSGGGLENLLQNIK